MQGKWEDIERLRQQPLRSRFWEGLPESAAKEITTYLSEFHSRSQLDNPESTFSHSSANRSILAAWSHWAMKQYTLAEKVANSVHLGPQLSDPQYLAIVELRALLFNSFGKPEETIKLHVLLLERFPDVIQRRSLPSLLSIGVAHLVLSEYEKAEALFFLCASASTIFEDHKTKGASLHNLGILFKNLGQLNRSLEYINRSIQVGKATGVPELALRLIARANLLSWKGQFPKALLDLEAARKRIPSSKIPKAEAAYNVALGRANLYLRNYGSARNELAKGLDIARELRFPREEALAYEFLGDLERIEGNSDKAGELYKKGMAIALRIAPRGDLVTELSRRLADWHLDRGENVDARKHIESALALAEEIGDRREEAILHRVRARLILASRGRRASAERSLTKSIGILSGMGARYEESLSLAELGKLKLRAPRKNRHERKHGLDDFLRAVKILTRLELPKHKLEMLLSAIRESEGVIQPHEGLVFVSEAEMAARDLDDQKTLSELASLRCNYEEEIAHRVDRRSKKRAAHKTGKISAEKGVQELAHRLDAKRVFLRLPWAPEGPRTIGCTEEDALNRLAHLPLSEEQNLIVSSGRIAGEGVLSGPYMAYRAKDESALIYVERAIGSAPFSDREASDLTTWADRLARRFVKRSDLPARGCSFPLVAKDPKMREIVDQIAMVRNSPASILLEGATGTGKGLIARLLHDLSDRRGEFVHIHCAEFPDSLVESELFGHTRGSFTGAEQEKMGLLESAHEGTLFLDEVGDLSPSVQLRLLRVLDEGRIKRIGEIGFREIDLRVVSATNRILEDEVAEKKFRQDLYYRLKVIRLEIPPLRDRQEDIPPLVRQFLESACEAEGKPVPVVMADAMNRFLLHSWPGNVRELQNEIKRVVALLPQGAPIDASQLSDTLTKKRRTRPRHRGRSNGTRNRTGISNDQESLIGHLGEMEKEMIYDALSETEGNLARAAHVLGISAPLLRYKMRKHAIIRYPARK